MHQTELSDVVSLTVTEVEVKHHKIRTKKLEEHYHSFLFLFCFFNFSVNNIPSYTEKFSNPAVIDIVNSNRALVDSHANYIDDAT